jgi:hypothetical protein
MHSVPLRSHLVQVGFRWLHRTLDSLQALHDARSRILFSSIIAGQLDIILDNVCSLLAMFDKKIQ